MSKNSARSLMADSARMSMDFMSEMVNVVKNCNKPSKE